LDGPPALDGKQLVSTRLLHSSPLSLDSLPLVRDSTVRNIARAFKYTLCSLTLLQFIFSVVFKNKFETKIFVEDTPAFVKLGCNAAGEYLTEISDGTIMCLDESTNAGSTDFLIDDVSGTFQRVSQGARDDISLSDTIYDGVFTKLITSNIFESFVESNFAAVIIFAIFGKKSARSS